MFWAWTLSPRKIVALTRIAKVSFKHILLMIVRSLIDGF
jgi:hypothetical protein